MDRAAGIDVSHWKPVKDWGALRAAGVSFVGIKASEGVTYVDPTFRRHQEEFRKHDFALGIFYHFARSGNPITQAERFLDVVGKLRANERVCLDLEVSPMQRPILALEWVNTFYNIILGAACGPERPFIYTSKRFWRTIGDPLWDLASEVDLWVPRYNAEGSAPAVPHPWTSCGWTIWQWTDGEYPEHVTPGVGKCDANWFKGDEAALRAYAAGRAA